MRWCRHRFGDVEPPHDARPGVPKVQPPAEPLYGPYLLMADANATRRAAPPEDDPKRTPAAHLLRSARSRPLLTYFALTFGISWGGILIAVGLDGLSGMPQGGETRLPFVYLAMLAGPSVAAILMTGLVQGSAGVRGLLSRPFRWRVGVRWYAIALLTAPLLLAATLLLLALFSHDHPPSIVTTSDTVSLLLTGLAVGLVVGIFEEFGWTGFAVPAARTRHGVFIAGLIVGVAWGAWHTLVMIWGGGTPSSALELAILSAQLFAWLPAFRILMTWMHDRTESLPVAMLMHAGLTASVLILQPAVTGAPLLTFLLAWAGVLWLVVALVAVTDGRRRLRQPLSNRVA